MTDRRTPADPIEAALRLLADEARRRLERHPSGHLLGGLREAVELRLELPLASRGAGLGEAAAAAAGELDRALAGLLAHHAAFQPGAVYCLRCGDTGCEHATAFGPREVFAGYGATGVPRFIDFAQLLLERSDPRLDRLYAEPPALLAHTLLGRDLTRELLPAYRDADGGYRLHGQVVAGWYRVPAPTGRPEPLAISFQAVSTRPPGGRGGRRLGLNVLGRGPQGEPLESLFDRLGELPWADAVREAQEELAAIEGELGGRRGPRRKVGDRQLDRRVLAVLNALAGRLEKSRRAAERKTGHARVRHAQGDRPTPLALADLARAGADDVLFDLRRQTLVVLGERGRAHVFNPGGKLVTSIRYDADAVERRRRKDRWRPASRQEIVQLKERALPHAAG